VQIKNSPLKNQGRVCARVTTHIPHFKEAAALSQRTNSYVIHCNGGNPSKPTAFSALHLRDDFRIGLGRRLPPHVDSLWNRVLILLFLFIDFII